MCPLVLKRGSLENPRTKWRFLAGRIIELIGKLSIAMSVYRKVSIFNGIFMGYIRLTLYR